MKRNTVHLWAGLVLIWVSGPASAQLVAVDDLFPVPYAQQLVVEAPGVLDNDTYNGEPAVDAGATAMLISGPLFGTLECSTNPGLDVCADGSFLYTAIAAFPGSDTFVYQTQVGIETMQATATLSACSDGPDAIICWEESEFLTKVSELGLGTFQEGFEDDLAWGQARLPDTMPSVVSQGIAWQSNHPLPPANNHITTGGGPASSGQWAIFDPEHGYATGTPQECDVDNPPDHCLFKDGFTGTRQMGESRLQAVGGLFTGSGMPKLVMILDGGAPLDLGRIGSGHRFFGVIQTAGFESFRVEETNGKIGQARFVFADDFTFGVTQTLIFADGFESGNTSTWSAP